MLVNDVSVELGRRIAASIAKSYELDITPRDTLVRISTQPGVDYQCDIAMGLGKNLRLVPREVATTIANGLATDGLIETVSVAGPGFINMVLTDKWLESRAVDLLSDERLGVPVIEAPRRIAVDYSSPNVAKEMHVGHLRSSIIGDALVRLLRFAGHEVIPHNHLGDWGTPFGMLIEHLIDEGQLTSEVQSGHSISDLNGAYQEARKKFDADSEFAERSRQRVVLLQGGDQQTLALWQELVNESTRHFEKVYALLGIGLTPNDIYGESFYNPYLSDVVDDLETQGITEISDGALCIFPEGFRNRQGDRLPLIIRKSDGGYGYFTTDLATVRYWIDVRDVDDLLYVIGNPQAQHLAMIFAAARMAGWLPEGHHAEHIGFGSMLGTNGKTIRSRAGGSIRLVELLNEAIDRAATVIADREILNDTERKEIARAVGIGAVKYADLSSDRIKDYVFDWDRMLAMEGNTAVYLQYAAARTFSILRKVSETPYSNTAVTLTEPAERELLLKIVQFPPALTSTVETYAPHRLCTYLYETATAFSTFYEKCPILAESVPANIRCSRLVLVKLTSNVLTLGLSLLGIETPQRL